MRSGKRRSPETVDVRHTDDGGGEWVPNGSGDPAEATADAWVAEASEKNELEEDKTETKVARANPRICLVLCPDPVAGLGEHP